MYLQKQTADGGEEICVFLKMHDEVDFGPCAILLGAVPALELGPSDEGS